MPLRVYCALQYLTQKVEEMRDPDYTGIMVVKAVKGKDPGGRRKTIRLRDQTFTFGPGNPGPAVDAWVAWAAHRLRELLPSGPVVLVPVPNSNAVHGSVEDFQSAEMARRVAHAAGARFCVETELWFDQQLKPAHGPSDTSGPRFANQVYPHLVHEPSATQGTRVLIDDVMTSGGHLRACAAKLREIDRAPEFALCCGRTVHEQLENPFAVPVEELPDFDPNDPFQFFGFSEDGD
jgi:hypothetical protein